MPSSAPTLREASRVWWRIGCLSFGGPAAQIALIHREAVASRGWLAERDYLSALSFCMLLPGPEAMQIATYAGWRLHGVRGGLIAGLGFVVPGAVVMMALAALYALFGGVPVVEALFLGIKAAVVAIVLEALLRVSRRALREPSHWAIAALAFIALSAFDAPYPLVIAAAGACGLADAAMRTGADSGDAGRTRPAPVPWMATMRTVLTWLAAWLVPVAVLVLVLPGSVLSDIARLFSVLATVTFGGAYAVLAFLAQEAVEGYGWLSAPEMADALGLAETTPGPLILVVQFVGFLAGARAGGGLDLWMGVLGALVTLWATFAPCFLWVFAGAPYVERIATMPRLKGALDAITAAVVGVILNLSVWFALQVAFGEVTRFEGTFRPWVPDPATLDWRVPVIAVASGILLLQMHWGVGRTLMVAALGGLVLGLVG